MTNATDRPKRATPPMPTRTASAVLPVGAAEVAAPGAVALEDEPAVEVFEPVDVPMVVADTTEDEAVLVGAAPDAVEATAMLTALPTVGAAPLVLMQPCRHMA